MKIPDRLKWQFRRIRLQRMLAGFWAHWDTYASSNCTFSEYNALHKKSWVVDSIIGPMTYITGARVAESNIGNFCSIAFGAIVGGLSQHPTNYLSTHPAFYSINMETRISFVSEDQISISQRCSIGNDVWIGANAMILPGVNIGNGAIVGAGAVVTKDIPPYAIVGGTPARLIRYRFSETVISALEEWGWWKLPISVLAKIAPLFIERNDWSLQEINMCRNEAEKELFSQNIVQ